MAPSATATAEYTFALVALTRRWRRRRRHISGAAKRHAHGRRGGHDPRHARRHRSGRDLADLLGGNPHLVDDDAESGGLPIRLRVKPDSDRGLHHRNAAGRRDPPDPATVAPPLRSDDPDRILRCRRRSCAPDRIRSARGRARRDRARAGRGRPRPGARSRRAPLPASGSTCSTRRSSTYVEPADGMTTSP